MYMFLAFSMMFLFLHFEIAFCSSLLESMNCFLYSLLLTKPHNDSWYKLSPLNKYENLIFWSIWFFASFLSILNTFKVSDLTLRKNINVLLLKSSIKLIKYFDLDNDSVDIRLHKFMCINCNGDVVLNKTILWNLSLVCLFVLQGINTQRTN
jgi:hypothetical protein